MTLIETPRLLIRRWREADRAPFAALNADPRVMRHFPQALTPEESDAMIGRMEAHQEKRGFSFWAAEERASGDFVGAVGLLMPGFQAHFTPCVEIGWRLAARHWGKGYASEGAAACLEHGFGALGLAEIVSFTVPANEPSWKVMRRIGMTRNEADDFDHPALPEGHPLRRHLLYRKKRP